MRKYYTLQFHYSVFNYVKRGKCRFYVCMGACVRETLHPMLFFPSAERPFAGSGNPGLAITIYFWSVLMWWVYLLYNTLAHLAFLIAWLRDIKIIMNMLVRRSECTGAVGEHQALVRWSTTRSTTLEPQSWHVVESTSAMAAATESQGSHSVRRSIERLLFYPSFAILKIWALVKKGLLW